MRAFIKILVCLVFFNHRLALAGEPGKDSMVRDGDTHLAAGEFNQAMESYTEALRKDKNDPAVRAKFEKAMNGLLAQQRKTGNGLRRSSTRKGRKTAGENTPQAVSPKAGRALF
jgi:hypothetical protein